MLPGHGSARCLGQGRRRPRSFSKTALAEGESSWEGTPRLRQRSSSAHPADERRRSSPNQPTDFSEEPYFDYLWSFDYADGKVIVSDWICRHLPGPNRAGWHAYPISVRLMNWCCFFFGRHRGEIETNAGFLGELWGSVFHQVQWLVRRLEWHLRGNHLLENASALAMAGCCFDGRAGERWRRRGCSLLAGQLREQILTDGMHFARSPMYHLRAVSVVATLRNAGVDIPGVDLSDLLARMVAAMWALCHPDGQISLFNDSALGIQNSPEELAACARALEAGAAAAVPQDGGAFALPEAGYYGSRCGGGTYVLCDAGPLGPDYNPGHAHGDMFSFELSLRGRRVVVDAGCFEYAPGPMRAFCRSTRAHNTVEIDGSDQAEFWGAFRVARRGHPVVREWTPLEESFRLVAEHDGYRRWPSAAVHTRHFRFHPPGILMFRDAVRARTTVRAVCRLHLHSDCAVSMVSPQEVGVSFPGGGLRIRFAGQGAASVEESLYCPEFGCKISSPVVAFALDGRRTAVACCIAPTDAQVHLTLSEGARVDGREIRLVASRTVGQCDARQVVSVGTATEGHDADCLLHTLLPAGKQRPGRALSFPLQTVGSPGP